MDKAETKVCQNCKKEFTIEPEDFIFYKKMKVPPPTFCPECRLQRKLAWRNERSLYKRKCDFCNKHIIAIYPSKTTFPVYCHECWWSDKWDPLSYGRKYDFSKSFFLQFKELQKHVPRLALSNKNIVNSEYCNQTTNLKNCYLIFGSSESEECYYGKRFLRTKDSIDCLLIEDGEHCYENIDGKKNFKTAYSFNSQGCIDTKFMLNCRNCTDCFLCVNLRSKAHCLNNIQYSREEYIKKVASYFSDTQEGVQTALRDYDKLRLKFPHKYRHDIQAKDSTGDYLFHTRDVRRGFNCSNVESGAHLFDVWFAKDLMDCFAIYGPGEKSYEVMSAGYGTYETKFTYDCWPIMNTTCSEHCYDSSYLFGCTGLRHKKYCILNKQYTKEEYEELVPKIIQHMNELPYEDKKGRIYKYGEFFPVELSPFAYNETPAQEYFPLTKEEAQNKGYTWKEPEKRNYEVTLKLEQLPENIKDVDDSILNEIIGCEHEGKCQEQCTEAFKIIPQELEFYRKMNLPLPRLCPNCRHYQRLKQRNPLKLWHRKCMCAGTHSENKVYENTIGHFHGNKPCPNEFETSYSPDRKEIVYCEKCYQSEVV